ncbi:unnamed protein product [Echinostoma caproni]|uniref:MHD domain-containing protein n=1 Tax=Echinostoma caproni TaxID=27848 RepID=A0A183AAS0_9TREM|nr:unnamed protein product [Echinostoma caproni]
MTLPQQFDSQMPDPNVTQLIQEEAALESEPNEQMDQKLGTQEANSMPTEETSELDEANGTELNELGVPTNAVEDTSDVDEPVDDVLWGGFSEVHVSSTETPNPFSGDDFSVLPTATVERKTSLSAKSHPADEQLKAIARPRNKPVRQETLSGNNPFRKRTDMDQEDEEVDELTRAAAGIELVSVKKPSSHKIRDSFESSGSSVEQDTGLTLKPVADDTYDTTIEPHELQETVDSGFDPLKTIYPESENESLASEDHELKTKEPTLSITINKLPTEPKSATENNVSVVPTIQAPPKPPEPEKPKSIPEVKPEEPPKDAEVVKHELPAGWIDFSEEPEEPTEKAILSADEAFNVDWAAVTRSQPTEPEPPRPDTPDPDLDIPFHQPAEEDKTRVKQVSKYTTDRYWREIAVHFTMDHDHENTKQIAPEPYRSIRIEPYMQLSREKLQQYDKYGKLHVFKLNHVSYRELVGIRPEKFSIKTLQNLVTHKPKQNVAVDHLPVYTEILKFGSLDQSRVRQLMPVFEDALMKIPAHKDSTLNYSREEVCCYVVDEYQGKVSKLGTIVEQKARTRILCTAFVNGGPHIVLGLNDKWRFGREVVRRADILPVMHDEWISIRNPEFHSCVEMDAYEKDHMLKFYPLDGCRFELLRFRVSLRGNRELPMQVKCLYSIDGRRVCMRCELLVPGFFSACNRKGAVPCENVEIHIPVPEDWIYHFRVEKHHKYGSVHSTLRKPGRIKGLERITQMAQSLLPPSILEASIGLAKYEHLYKAVVWRIPRIPDKHEASFRPHLLTCKLNLAAHDTVPEWETLVPDCQVEYTMPSSTVSGATVRSISVEHTGVAEKFVKYTSKYRYVVEIDYQLGARKEPLLKGIFDEPTQTAESETAEEAAQGPSAKTDQQEQLTEQPPTGEVADLLGLGMDFGETVPESRPSQESATKGENTLDLF